MARCPGEGRTDTEALAEAPAISVTDRISGSGDVQDARRLRAAFERTQRVGIGIALPDGVDVADRAITG